MASNQTFTLNIKALFDASDVKAKVGDIQSALSKLKLPDKLSADLTASIANVNKALDNFTSKVEKGVKTKTDATAITNSFEAVTKELNKLDGLMAKVKSELNNSVDLSKIIKIDEKTKQDLDGIANRIKTLQQEIANINTSKLQELQNLLSQIKSGSGAAKQGAEALKLFEAGDVDGALAALDKIINKLQAYREANQNSGKDLTNVSNSIKQLTQMYELMSSAQEKSGEKLREINNLSSQAAQKLNTAQQSAVTSTNAVADALHQEAAGARAAKTGIDDLTSSQAQFMREVDQIKSRIQYFFGLSNSINLVKRAIRGAVETIKDLDKAMTETAVVTDFTISDMWKQLPEYTKRANELGVTTQAAYEAATLYYQQGLKTNEVNALSVETLKMARIAGLDAAEATDRMTNALRGFNMELTTANAQRVDDVYSELAANTASNVDEISTAMTKVASLAHSANMEFETTSAFLAQIIETTRESAETAGTALKTVVARFSEVKKLVDTDQLKGTDEEGEVVDVNKVSEALRTAGIDLNKYFLGEVGLDDIFMELSSKWDSLTSVQQRYIATQAAGSRQQSRFIALMQDYARMQELVGKAYDSEGASAKQFEKTQDSLQSKLARLKNAWNEFLMGLTNNSVVKGAVDLLTRLINGVNKLTSAFGEGIGTILKWAAALTTLWGLRALFSNGGIVVKGISKLLGDTPLGNAWNKISGTGKGGGEALTNAAIRSGQALEAGATKAAQILAGGATEAATIEVSGEEAGAAAEVVGEEAGAAVDAAGEAAGAAAEETIEVAGAVEEEAIEQGASAFKGFAQVVKDATLVAGAGAGTVGAGGATVITAGSTGGAIAGGAGGALAGAGLGAAAIPAAVIAAIVSAVVGSVAVEDYLKSGKREVKLAEKAVETQQDAAEKQQDVANLQKDAYNKYIENEKILNDSTSTSLERANAQAAMSEAVVTLSGIDSKNVINDNGRFTLNKAYTEKRIKELEEAATISEASGDFAQAALNMAEAARAQKQTRVYNEDTRQWTNAGGSSWQDLKFGWQHLWDYDDAEVIQSFNDQQAAIAEAFTASAQEALIQGAEALLKGQYSNEVTDSIAQAYGALFSGNNFQQEVEQISGVGRLFGRDNIFNKKDLKQQYEAIYGVGSAEGLSVNDLSTLLAQYDVTKKEQQRLKDFATVASTSTGQQILGAMQGTVELDIDNASEEVRSVLEQLAAALGREVSDVEAQIKQGQELRKKQAKANKASIYEAALRNGKSIDTNLENYLNNLDFNQLSIVTDAVNSVAGKVSETAFNNLFDQLPKLANEELTEISTFFSGFNLDDPISAVDQLNSKIESLGKTGRLDSAFGQLLVSVKEVNKELFSTSSLFQSFYMSEAYDELSDSLDEFIEENGHISSKNIEDLAKSNSTLDKLLKNTTASTKSLANALTALKEGKVPIEGITDALLDALDVGTSFKDLMDDVSNWISDFDEGTDMKEGTEHITSELENLKEYVENWEFGNEPTENIYDHIFGEGAYDEYMSSAWGQKSYEEIEADLTGNIDRIAAYAENEGLGALQALSGELTGLSSDASGLNFEWDLSSFENTDQAIDEVASKLGIAREAAEAFIEAWGSHMYDLREEWDTLSFQTRLESFLTDVQNTGYATEEQLIALGASVDEAGNLSTEALQEVIDKINEIRVAAGKEPIELPIIVKWSNENGPLEGKELISEFTNTVLNGQVEADLKINADPANLEESANAIAEQFVSFLGAAVKRDQENGQITGINYSAAMDQMADTAMSEGQAEQAIDWLVKQLNTQLVDSVKLPSVEVQDDGSSVTTTIEKGVKGADCEALKSEIEAETEAANYNLIAEHIADVGLEGLAANVKNAVETGAGDGAANIASIVSAAGPVQIHYVWIADNSIDTSGLNQGSTGGEVPTHNTHGSSGARAAGGIVPSYANGSSHYIAPGPALTGEEGPEIIWNKKKGYAYITGERHPEIQNLQPGDRVFPADETRKILGSAANGGKIPAYASGGWNPKKVYGDSGSGSGSSDSGSSDSDYTEASTWRNELDWLYDLMEDIAEYERQQTIIQSKYELAVEDLSSTGRDLFKLTQKELVNLQTQLKAQETAYTKRLQQMGELQTMVNAEGYGRYVQWNQKDQTLEIDWDAIEAIQDKDTYDEVTDWIDRMEEVQDQMDDATDAIWDIKQQIQELQDRYLEKYLDFQDRVMDAVVAQYQSTIDNLSELNDKVNDTNSAILDSIQKEIDLERQIRDNTDTEKNIADMEARLAYMQRDTTGANEGQIRALEKQLEDARESYSDTLVDQAVDRLSEANDAASAQREKQIELMQAQLDYWQESGGLWGEVANLIANGFASNGSIITGSDLWETLKKGETWDAMSAAQKKNWANELILETNEVGAHLIQISDGNTVNSAKVRASIADERGILTQNISAAAETVRAALPSLTGSIGGTPEHSYTAVKTDDDDSSSSSSSYTTDELNSFLSTLDDNFLQLADVMPAVSSGSVNTTNNYGNSPFNVNVNVGSIASDYDVDSMINRIKDELYSSASYRTGNVLSFTR